MGRDARFLRGVVRIGLLVALLAWLAGCGGDGATDTAAGDAAAGDAVAGPDTPGADVPAAPDAARFDVPPPDVASDAPGPDVPPPADVLPDGPAPDGPAPADVPPDGPADPCVPNPCLAPHRGVCAPADGAPGYTCSCEPGYVDNGQGGCAPDVETCGGDADCDDGLWCNGAERCAPETAGAAANGCAPGAAPPVDDGDACTTDICDEATQTVTHEPLRCPTNGRCVANAAGVGVCRCDPGYEMNDLGLCRACEIDPQEPNHTPAEARPLVFATGQRLNIDPLRPDWFLVPLCAGGTATIELYYDDRLGDVDMYLLDADAETVLASSTGASSTVRIVYTSPVDSDAYLRIVMLDGGCARYSLSFLREGCAVCEDDAFEPNDRRGAAAGALDAAGQPLFLASGGEDWFRVYLCKDQYVRFRILYDGETTDVRVRLVGQTSELSLANSNRTEEGQAIEYVAPATGDYYVVLDTTEFDACIPYELAVERSSCELPCESDALEENDTPANAAPLGDAASDAGGETRLGVLAGDDDWYVADLCAGEGVKVRLRAAEGALLTQALVAPDGETVLDAGVPGPQPIEYTAVSDETVLLRVTTENVACEPYTLLIERTGCRSCQDDEGEDDDTQATARPLSLGEMLRATVCDGDDDWFALELCDATAVRVETYFGASEGGIEVTLFDRDGTTVLASGTGPNGAVALTYGGVVAGTYYLRQRLIADQRDPGVRYDLLVNAYCCRTGDIEPNDDPESATPLITGGPVGSPVLSVGLKDWFVYAACADQPLTPRVGWTTATAPIDASLVAADGMTVLDEGTPTADGRGETFAYTPTVDGPVYVRVVGLEGYCVDYTLDPGPLPECAPAP
jgi:hypothetical protein